MNPLLRLLTPVMKLCAAIGMLGMRGSGSGRTGPGEGKGIGQRDGGTPEPTRFEKKRLPPNELNAGQIAGQLPVDGEAPKGEARLPVRMESRAALQRMAEKVETEVLPAEYRDQVLKYMELLRTPEEGAKTP